MRPYRKDRLASAVREVMGEAIAHELNDPRISNLTSVTRVEMSGDLQIATVYVSVIGDEAESRKTLAGLHHAEGHLQRRLASRLQMRQCPEVRFKLDLALKGAAETLRIIEESLREDREAAEARGRAAGRPVADSKDGDGG